MAVELRRHYFAGAASLRQRGRQNRKNEKWNGGRTVLGVLIIILVAIAFIALLPIWPYSKNWGYYSSGIVGILLILAIVLLLIGVF
jgi:Protein of unknown function (DUF3309)